MISINRPLAILLLCLVFFCGCAGDGKTPEQRDAEENQAYKSKIIDFGTHDKNIKVNTVEIDSCEYLFAWFGSGTGRGGGSFTHKGNCKYCAIRATH